MISFEQEQIYNSLVKELGSEAKFESKKAGKDIRFTVDPNAPPADSKGSDREK